MGAHSVDGHLPVRTVTAAAGMAAALVTTAATGLLTGGTALATDGSDGPGHGHGHRHHHAADDRGGEADALASQTLCDVLGDVPLGVGMSCSSGSSDASGDADSSGPGDDGPAPADPGASTGVQQVSAPAPAAPKPRPTSKVPAQSQLLPIKG